MIILLVGIISSNSRVSVLLKMASSAATEQDSAGQQQVVERTNFLNMAKLAIKGLIESAMKDGKVLDDSHSKLQQLCIVLEYIVDHRLKGLTWPIIILNI